MIPEMVKDLVLGDYDPSRGLRTSVLGDYDLWGGLRTSRVRAYNPQRGLGERLQSSTSRIEQYVTVFFFWSTLFVTNCCCCHIINESWVGSITWSKWSNIGLLTKKNRFIALIYFIA